MDILHVKSIQDYRNTLKKKDGNKKEKISTYPKKESNISKNTDKPDSKPSLYDIQPSLTLHRSARS